MIKFQSDTVTVNQSAEKVYDYLFDLNHIKELLPEGKFEQWKADEEHCSFKIAGAAKIAMKRIGSTPHSEILLRSDEPSSLKFDLTIQLTPAEDGKCKGHFICNADLNPMMKLMVEKPLKNLFNYMANRLKEVI